MPYLHIQTDVPIINPENMPVMVKHVKQKHLGSFTSHLDKNDLTNTIAHWSSIQQHLVQMHDKDQNVVIGHPNGPFGLVMFVNLNLAKNFCVTIIESLKKDVKDAIVSSTD